MAALAIAAIVAALIWAYLLVGRGYFWRIGQITAQPGAAALPRRVAVIIPARNEAAVIARSIVSLLEFARKS